MFHLPQIATLTDNLLPLIGSILAFLSIITVHEFGHFIFCKLFNVKTPTFSIGAGPVIAKKMIGETEFILSLLPVGGFVEIGGLSEPGQGDQASASDRSERSFEMKPYWQKMLILCGGIFFNILFAFIVYTTLYATGMPKVFLTNVTITSVSANGPADRAGLQEGDLIVGVNHKEFASTEGAMSSIEFTKTLLASNHSPLYLLVQRNERHLKLTITPESDPKDGPTAPAKIMATLASNGSYGLSPGLDIVTSAKKAYIAIYDQAAGTFSMMGSLFKERTLTGIGGPVMIFSQLFKTAKVGFRSVLLFVCYVNIGLAVINVLPLGALDGGQIAFATIEFVTRRKLHDTFKIWVNIFSIILFGTLFLYLTFRDALALFGY